VLKVNIANTKVMESGIGYDETEMVEIDGSLSIKRRKRLSDLSDAHQCSENKIRRTTIRPRKA